MAGKYDKYIRTMRNLQANLSDAYPVEFKHVSANNMRLGHNMVLAYRLITELNSWVHPAHSHNYQEFLAWYGADPKNPADFDAEIVFHIGEEMEKHTFTGPTIVSLPPGLIHCPLEITGLRKPIIQIAINCIDEVGKL